MEISLENMYVVRVLPMPHFLPPLSNLPVATVLQVNVIVSLFKKKGWGIH